MAELTGDDQSSDETLEVEGVQYGAVSSTVESEYQCVS